MVSRAPGTPASPERAPALFTSLPLFFILNRRRGFFPLLPAAALSAWPQLRAIAAADDSAIPEYQKAVFDLSQVFFEPGEDRVHRTAAVG